MHWIKRHLKLFCAALGGLAFIGGAVFLMMRFGANSLQEKENFSKAKKEVEEILSPSSPRPSQENISKFIQSGKLVEQFIAEADKNIKAGSVQQFDPSIFIRQMIKEIGEMNRRAKEAKVELPNTSTNAVAMFHFTFGHLVDKTELPKNRLSELNIAIGDIKGLTAVLFGSHIRSLDKIQRIRLLDEDAEGAASTSPYLMDDLASYVNEVVTVHPYRIEFKSLSGGLSQVLSGMASADSVYVVRSVSVTTADPNDFNNNNSGSGGPGGMGGGPGGMGGGPGGIGGGLGGGPAGGIGGVGRPGGGAGVGQPAGAGVGNLSLAQINYLVSQGFGTMAAVTVLDEKLLKISMQVDVIRRKTVAKPQSPAPGK